MYVCAHACMCIYASACGRVCMLMGARVVACVRTCARVCHRGKLHGGAIHNNHNHKYMCYREKKIQFSPFMEEQYINNNNHKYKALFQLFVILPWRSSTLIITTINPSFIGKKTSIYTLRGGAIYK